MVCVLKDRDSCRHHPLRPIPTRYISPILPTEGTHTGFLYNCLPAPQHIPGSPSSKGENFNHLISKHQCLWRHSYHDKACKRETASPDPISKETSAQIKSLSAPTDNGSNPKNLDRLKKKRGRQLPLVGRPL